MALMTGIPSVGWGGPNVAIASNTAAPVNTNTPVTNPVATTPAGIPPVTLGTQYANPAVINQPGQAVPPTGLIGSEQALTGGLMGAASTLAGGTTQARADLTGAMNNVGVSNASTMQADLSGANGPQKQQAAIAAYQSNPAMKYQMDQAILARDRSASAKGGLMGGNVGLELNRDLAGILSQNYQQDFNNLGTVADRDLNTQTIKAGLARDLADTAMSAGIQGAGLISQNSAKVAEGRTNAGIAIAQNATQAASNISNLLNQQGIVVSDMISKDISTITDLLYQAGIQDSSASQNLGALLANIASGQGSTLAQGNAAIGASNAAGTIGIGNAFQNAISQGIMNYPRSNVGTPQPTNTNTGANYAGYA